MIEISPQNPIKILISIKGCNGQLCMYVNYIMRFAIGPEKNSISTDRDNSISFEENPTSITKKLFDAIEECKSPIKSINRITDYNTQLSKGKDLFTSGGSRCEYLQATYIRIFFYTVDTFKWIHGRHVPVDTR